MGGLGFCTCLVQPVDGAITFKAQPFFTGRGQWIAQSPLGGVVDPTHARCSQWQLAIRRKRCVGAMGSGGR